MHLGRVGLWTFQLELMPADEVPAAAAELESLGFGAIWIPEAVSREAMTNAALLLSATERIVVGTGIANIYGRDPMAAASAHATLNEAFPGRFVLGLGVSHQQLVEGLRGHAYDKPYATMRGYLEAMNHALVMIPEPAEPPVRVIGALGPRMLALSAELASGAHPYNMTPEHTAGARSILGEGPLLLPEQAVVLETDPVVAREAARRHLAIYLDVPNYVNGWRRLGFGDDDFGDGGSDRLADAVVAWGDVDALVGRVRAHLDAGADHVCVQVLLSRPDLGPLQLWRELAPALLDA